MSNQENYKEYVGPGDLYDVIGAAQFSLLYAMGLRSSHKLLDFGCGSLRAGRLFIPYLDFGNYYGIDPNQWLVADCIKKEIGEEIIKKRSSHFMHNDDFSTDVFGETFDFILAQSIFTHTGTDLFTKIISNMKRSLNEAGMILATFFVDDVGDTEQGWFYEEPKTVIFFKHETIKTIATQQELFCCDIPYYHPRGQKWYLFAKDEKYLPEKNIRHLFNGISLYKDKEAFPYKLD